MDKCSVWTKVHKGFPLITLSSNTYPCPHRAGALIRVSPILDQAFLILVKQQIKGVWAHSADSAWHRLGCTFLTTSPQTPFFLGGHWILHSPSFLALVLSSCFLSSAFLSTYFWCMETSSFLSKFGFVVIFFFQAGSIIYCIIESQTVITPSATIQKYFLEQLFTVLFLVLFDLLGTYTQFWQ